MAWHASNSEVMKRLKMYCHPCSTCDYCQTIGVVDGHLKNRCTKNPGGGFLYFARKILRATLKRGVEA